MSADSAPPSSPLARLRTEGGWFPVGDVARFAVTGTDRVRYLNGQVSNDVRKLRPGQAMQACILSAKGRLDAVVWLWPEESRIVVESDASLAEALAARLERYVVADDVEIARLPGAAGFHVFGRAAEAFSADAGSLEISRMGLPGVDLPHAPAGVGPAATMEEVEWLRIFQGVPKWGNELSAETLPVEAGLDGTAVDFHKGCYLGQEVVSRIKSVGHANRALRGFTVAAGPAPAVATELFASGDPARVAAVVTSVHFALSPAIGLCYIRRGTSEGTVLTTATGDSQIQLRQPECVTPS